MIVFVAFACAPSDTPPYVDFTTDRGSPARCAGYGTSYSGVDGTVNEVLVQRIGDGWSTLEEHWPVRGWYQTTRETTDVHGELLTWEIERWADGVESTASETWIRDEDGRPLSHELVVDGDVYIDVYVYEGDLLARIDHFALGEQEFAAETRFSYDEDGRKLEERTEWDVQRWTYAAAAPALDAHFEQDIGDDGSIDEASDWWYDASGRLVQVTWARYWLYSSGATEWTYDDAGREVREYNLYTADAGTSERERLTAYDADGLVLEAETWTGESGAPLALAAWTSWSWDCDLAE